MTTANTIIGAVIVISWLLQWYLNSTKDAKIEYQNFEIGRLIRQRDELDKLFDEEDMLRSYKKGAFSQNSKADGIPGISKEFKEWLAATYRDPVQENEGPECSEHVQSMDEYNAWIDEYNKQNGYTPDYRLNRQYQEANNPYYDDCRDTQYEQWVAKAALGMKEIEKIPEWMKGWGIVDIEQYNQLEREYGHVSTSDAHIDEAERLYWESEAGKEQLRIMGKS